MPVDVVAVLPAEVLRRFRTQMDLASWRHIRSGRWTRSLIVTALASAVAGR